MRAAGLRAAIFFAAFAGAFFAGFRGLLRLLRGLFGRFFEVFFAVFFFFATPCLLLAPTAPGDPNHTIGELEIGKGPRIAITPRAGGLTVTIPPLVQDRGWRRRMAAIALAVAATALLGACRLGLAWDSGMRRGDFGDLPLPVLVFLSLAVLVSAPLALVGLAALAFAEERIDVDAGGRHDPDDRLREDPHRGDRRRTTSTAGARPTGRCPRGGRGRSSAWRPARAGASTRSPAPRPRREARDRPGPRRRHRQAARRRPGPAPSASRAA